MPTTHVEIFKVRHYECDTYGHLNNAVYLRYMQQAGIEAAASVGYTDKTLHTLNRTWIPRLIVIEYLQPVRFGETLEVTTWVDGVRRVLSRRRYEFRIVGQKEPVATAFTDWVFVDMESGLPVTIPDEVMLAFYPEGIPKTAMKRTLFPHAPPAPPGIFQVNRRVEWGYTDPMSHLNNAAYFTYAEDCAVQLTATLGWPVARWMEEGIAIVARRSIVEYLKPAFLDDELSISTWLVDVRPASVTRHYEFGRADEIIAKLQTRWVMVDINNGRPQRIPDFFLEAFASNMSSQIR